MRRVRIDPSDLPEMILERLIDYDRGDLVAFWERNWGNDPKVEIDENGDGLIATYEDEE